MIERVKQSKKIVDLSKMTAFAEDDLDAAQIMRFFFDRVENIVQKGENADYQHFLLFSQYFISLVCQDH